MLGALRYVLYLVKNRAGKKILEKIQHEINFFVAIILPLIIILGVSNGVARLEFLLRCKLNGFNSLY